jgi:hypothetical protein
LKQEGRWFLSEELAADSYVPPKMREAHQISHTDLSSASHQTNQCRLNTWVLRAAFEFNSAKDLKYKTRVNFRNPGGLRLWSRLAFSKACPQLIYYNSVVT